MSPIHPATTPTSNLHLTLKVRAFRAFRDEATLELRPLTLLYGHNQAGKSSLLRLVSFISDSLRPNTPALNLDSPSLRGATFKELGWMGKNPIFSPHIKIIASGKPNQPMLALKFAKDDDGMFVDDVEVIRARDKFSVSLVGDVVRDSGRSLSAQYAGHLEGQDWTGILSFQRLLPTNLPGRAADIVKDIEDALGPLNRVQWLHANRLADGPDGNQANGAPLAARFREAKYREVLESTSEWIRQTGSFGDEIAIDTDPAGKPRLVLGFWGRERLPLHLAGEGVRSLLPVVLCASWAEWGRRTRDIGAPSLLAIEEPETNLHPHLHVALFERLLETVRAGIPVVLETHSVYVLRAMQVAVLKGKIDPAHVALHWVEQSQDRAATVMPIEVDAEATLGRWQPHAFEKEQELAHEILDLRWKRLEGL